ncbi:hypothetical protein PMAYCL1PPCAC_16858, partial [Pristionchus mayeri]
MLQGTGKRSAEPRALNKVLSNYSRLIVLFFSELGEFSRVNPVLYFWSKRRVFLLRRVEDENTIVLHFSQIEPGFLQVRLSQLVGTGLVHFLADSHEDRNGVGAEIGCESLSGLVQNCL